MNVLGVREYEREKLEKELENVVEKPLIMVIAPSGYGKSTLVRQFFSKHDSLLNLWFPMQRDEVDGNWIWHRICNKIHEYNKPLYDRVAHLSLPQSDQEMSYMIRMLNTYVVRNVLELRELFYGGAVRGYQMRGKIPFDPYVIKLKYMVFHNSQNVPYPCIIYTRKGKVVDRMTKMEKVHFLEDYKIEIILADGKSYIFDMKPKLRTVRFYDLENKDIFTGGSLKNGQVVCWNRRSLLSRLQMLHSLCIRVICRQVSLLHTDRMTSLETWVTQNTAAASEESSAVSDELAQRAEELDHLVQNFKLYADTK